MELLEVTADKIVKQHNAITSGRYDFSACQLDVMFMLLANLNEDDEPNKRYNIRVKDIELITGRKWNYDQLKTSTEDLMCRVYEIQLEKSFRQITLFSLVEYLDGTGSFDMVINEYARPYFFELKNNFTLLELKSVLQCKSKHAKRIYGLACQWRGTGGKKYSLGDFKEILGLKDPKGKEPEQYTEITALKKEVLDRAKKQINGNTDITFDYELKKTRGRAYDTIIVYSGVSKPNLQQMEIDFKGDLEKQKKNGEILQKIANIQAVGIRDDLAELWAVKYWKQFVEEKNKLLEAIQKGKIIDDRAAYLVGIFKKKGYV
jgi:plasmid replication initiation protein